MAAFNHVVDTAIWLKRIKTTDEIHRNQNEFYPQVAFLTLGVGNKIFAAVGSLMGLHCEANILTGQLAN